MPNLYDALAIPETGERFKTLLQHRNLLIERITSSARITPSEYVQEQDEWVLLLRGSATLEVNGQRSELQAGDHVFLPAKTPHSVLSASDGALWLAVHLQPA